MRRHARARGTALLLVVLAHLALLAWWAAQRRPPAATPTPRVTLRLLPPVAQAARVADPAPPPAATAPARSAVRRESVARPRSVTPRAAAEAAVPPAAAPEPITVTRAAPAASQPIGAEAAPSLLDGEATRRAIRASARDPGLAAQAGRTGPAVATPDQQLGSSIAQGARGDCMKGEYFGGGAGLLSLPFLAAAALRDKCRH
jgi:hypothetical protein